LEKFFANFCQNYGVFLPNIIQLMIFLPNFALTLPKYTKTCADFCQYNILFPKKFAWQKSA
jgi:hypothetical protein